MSSSPAKKLAVLLASVVLSVAAAAPAFAQSGGGGGAAGDNSDAAKADTGAKPHTTKAERKAARKQARAKKNAELKKLEANGYNPSRNDPNYPNDIQKAQKKAGEGTTPSQ
jgi:hypothetical protein